MSACHASAGAVVPGLARAARAPGAPVRGFMLPPPPWRDELRLILALTGAAAIVFLPAALAVVGAPSLPFLGFALAFTVDWAVCITLQIAILRVIRGHARLSRLPLVAHFAALAIASVWFKLASDVFVGPFAERAHLGTAEGWRFAAAAWTSVLIALYLVADREGRRRHAIAARRLAAVQAAQVRARREVIDGQLRAVQARVDPQFFFATLDAVEALYRRDVARAEQLFDELVVFLRAALPHVDASSSVLARELELAASCTRIDALAGGRERALDSDVPAELMRLPFPAGVLLPLLQGALAAAADRSQVTISLRAELRAAEGSAESTLRLVVSTPCPPSEDVCQRVRASLRSLFGDAAALHLGAVGADRTDITVSLPHDEP